jgi:hypothetical protein
VLEELEKESMVGVVAEHHPLVVATLHDVMGEAWNADAGPSGHATPCRKRCSHDAARCFPPI